MNVQGCDLSHWNPPRDWAALRHAVDFVGIKASQGETFPDPALAADIVGARAQDFELVWYYHVAAPGDARGQAKRLLDLVAPLRPNERLVIDTERSSTVPFDYLDEIFDQLMAEVPDRPSMLYTSNGYWAGAGYPDSWDFAAKIPIILPRYGSAAEPVVPMPWLSIGKTWAMWQRSQSGHLPGIDGNVDLDVWNGDLNALRAFAALVPAGVPYVKDP